MDLGDVKSVMYWMIETHLFWWDHEVDFVLF